MYWKLATAMAPFLCRREAKHTRAPWLLDLFGTQWASVWDCNGKVMRFCVWAQPGKVSGECGLGHGLPSDSFLALRLVAVWANRIHSELLLSCRQNELTGRLGSEVESGASKCHSSKESTQIREAFASIITFFFIKKNTSLGIDHSLKMLYGIIIIFQILAPPPCCQYLPPSPLSHLICNLTRLHFFELLAHRSTSHSSDLPIHARSCAVIPPHQ